MRLRRRPARSALPVSHQTVRLARGRHAGPQDGTCVAELVSMLAGERYSDRPKCACPALTAFLRGYNDGLSDVRRQDLYALATDLVGTRSCEAVSTARGDLLLELAWSYRRRTLLGHEGPFMFGTRFDRYEQAGVHLGVCARRSPDTHAAVLARVREILAMPLSAFRLDGEPPNVLDLPVARVGEAVQRERQQPGGDDAEQHRSGGRVHDLC